MTPLNPVADSPFWRRGGFWILFLGALALAAILSRILVIGWTDRLWLDSLGVGSDHQSLARLRTFLWFFSWVAALVWTLGNLLVVVRSVESVHVPRRIGNLEITEILPRKYVILAMGVFGLLLATGLAAASATWWPARALIGAYQPTGLVDPVLGRDVAYYLLLLPWQRVVHGYVTILTVVILGVCIVLYAVVGAISREGWRISVGGRARRHLAALLALFACALFWGYRLELLEMVAGLKGPIAVGELESIRIPSIRLVGGVALATLLASLAWIRFRPVTIILVAWGVLGAASFVGRYLVGAAWDGAYQDAVGERAAFMEMAYGQRPIQPAERGQPAEDEGVSPGAVLWANGMATESLGRLTQDSQLVFFSGPPVSFETPAGERTWAITTVGEVDLSKRGGRAGSRWEDFHHVEHAVGGGFAVIDAAKTQPDGSPLFLIASLDRPTLGGDGAAGMHGLIDLPVRYGVTETGFLVDPTGAAAGVKLDGWLRRLALAWRLQSASILDSDRVPSGASVMWSRNVLDRLRVLAPFLEFEDVQPVLLGDSLSWLAYGYVASNTFPLTRRLNWNAKEIGYLSAAFIGVVNAHSGSAEIFRLDGIDPLADAWAALFDQTIKPFSAVSEELLRFLVYPREMFRAQAALYPEYGAGTNGSVFFGARTRPLSPGELVASWRLNDASPAGLLGVSESGSPRRMLAFLKGTVTSGVRSLSATTVDSSWDGWSMSQVEQRLSDAGTDDELIPGFIEMMEIDRTTVFYQPAYRVSESEVRVAEVRVLTPKAVAVGADFSEAFLGAASVERSQIVSESEMTEINLWFRRMDNAMKEGDWKTFGEAYENLRRAIEAQNDSR